MKKENRPLNLMEVCGTHTMAIARNGLRSLFPKNVTLLSGPGCPICVTPIEDIDRCIAIASQKNVIIATFGDMLHVPGSYSTLENERSKGADIRVVYSPVDALELAAANPTKEVVFPGVGFETTAPVFAATAKIAMRRDIGNFSILPMFKTIPNALRAILDIKERRIDGFLLPGHVSTIIGSSAYDFIPAEYGVPGVIAGFESEDILRSVDLLSDLIARGTPAIVNQYERSVTKEGNRTAQSMLAEVFTVVDSNWRAIGSIPKSGLSFSSDYSELDAAARFKIDLPPANEPKGCRCGDILLGLKKPAQCGLFGKKCTPRTAVGPCMVSSEGACAAEYKYGKRQG